jgi:hypothetical protein
MARKFLTPIDLNKLELRNAAIQNLAEAPASPNTGQVYYDTSVTPKQLKIWNGTAWVSVGNSQEEVEDIVAGLIVAGNGISKDYNDEAGTLTIANTGILSLLGTTNEVEVTGSSGSLTVGLPATINADTTGNAATATKLATARTISLSGNASGSASFDGSQNVDIAVTIDSESNVSSITGTSNEIDVSASVGAVTISLPETINANVSGNVTGNLTGNADTASKLAAAQTIALAGDVSGSASFDGSGSVSISTTIQPDSVALGTDTTGDYVATIGGTDGVSVSGSGTEGRAVTIANTDKGSAQNIFKTISSDSGAVTAASNSASVTIAGGTAISTSISDSTLTITNNGVTALTGTTNEIDVSASVGSITIGLPDNVTIQENLTVLGDFTVSGSVTFLDTEHLRVQDNIITLNYGTSGSPVLDSGIEVDRGDEDDVSLVWNETSDLWTLTNDGTNFHAIARKYAVNVGNESASSFAITHNMGTRDVTVNVYDNATYDTVETDVVRTDADTVTVSFAVAPGNDAYRVVIVG